LSRTTNYIAHVNLLMDDMRFRFYLFTDFSTTEITLWTVLFVWVRGVLFGQLSSRQGRGSVVTIIIHWWSPKTNRC